jgi:CheY-like chemotaxis protein
MDTTPLVMVIEDDFDLRTIYDQLIQFAGCRTCVFSNAKDALQALAANACDPHLLLLDYMLPEMNADQFLSVLPHTTKKEIPTVLVSALGGESAQIANARTHHSVVAYFSKTDITNKKLVEFVKNYFHLA